MNSALFRKPEATGERGEFYRRLDASSAAPLWEVLSDIVRTEPRSACVAALWSYDDVRPLVMESGEIITAKEAERRVLILENPGLRGQSRITQSLYAGMQLVLPGEIAPSHRHTASALRFILEGDGAYTAVDGERIAMHPGDLIVTPSWTYHDHGNSGDRPVLWLDGLDIPTVNHFDTSFAEHPPEGTPPDPGPGTGSRRTLSYPYARSRAALAELHRSAPQDLCHGVKMPYADSATGNSPMPVIGAFLQLLPAGFRGEAYRATDATVYCCAEGRGRTQAGELSFEWKERDVFVIPSWCPVSHEAAQEAVLFGFSDQPAQKALGIWREESPIARSRQ